MSSSLILRYWSTDFNVPRIEMSFFSSTVMVWFVRVLKKEKNSILISGRGDERSRIARFDTGCRGVVLSAELL